MLRRYETIAGGAWLRRARCRKVARLVPAALACFAVLTVGNPTALASTRDRKPAQKLWAAFPLNRTGDRTAPANRPIPPARDQQQHKAATRSFEEARPRAGRGFSLVLLAVSLIGILELVRIVWVTARQPRRAVTLRAGTAGPGRAHDGRLRAFVVPKRARARKRVRQQVRKVVWTDGTRPDLVTVGLAVVLAFFVVYFLM
jgi:hypothetical protein